ncbi:MAG: transcription elongation factor GreA, partial [Candidatus Kaiserbacteria bacterium]|nr:transcription elongation factor GreA [Candidatus Kaiserbacteria bacterium]
LITTKRTEVATQLEYARSLGDLSENAEYHQARQTQGEVEDRIKYLAGILKSVEIVKPHHSDMVEVGSTVSVQRKGEDETRVFHIVGSEEANMSEGRISLNSPLGQAMMGKKKGEVFTFTNPVGKKIEYILLKID